MLIGLVALGATAFSGAREESGTESQAARCARFTADSADRAAHDLGPGTSPTIVVVGDSWSVGLGLDDPATAWPSRLPGRVHVAGYSGSGFSEDASPCGAVSYADRAAGALADAPPGATVVVEGGLNDWDRTDAEITDGFERLLGVVGTHPLLVVGPAAAPARAAFVARVDAVLQHLCDAEGVAYLDPSGLTLDYLPDGLHPTQAGQERFGGFVAAALADPPVAR